MTINKDLAVPEGEGLRDLAKRLELKGLVQSKEIKGFTVYNITPKGNEFLSALRCILS